ncbi:MAG: condensation domain-containing protein, partial [Bradymonadaceae bacterium]
EVQEGRADGLVAYVVADKEETDPAPGRLRAHLAEHFPKAVVPGRYVTLDKLPTLSSGKLDRSSLPEPDERFREHERVEPGTETERKIADIWQQHLDLEEVGIEENFFEVGGQSLVAVRIANEIAEIAEVEISVEQIVESPTIRGLARYVEEAEASAGTAVEPRDYRTRAPLSSEQRRLWFLQKIDPANAAYHIPVGVRLSGELDRDALEEAFDQLVARHEILRTVFPERDDGPVQRIREDGELDWQYRDLRGEAGEAVEAKIDKHTGEPFDLTEEFPFRVRLWRTGDDEYVLLVVFH